MRWVFLFLMLANATVLFWYATTQPKEEVRETRHADLGLKLVSEMESGQLIARVDPVRVGLEALTPAPTVSCFIIGATDSLATANRIMNFFSERGQNALINQTPHPRIVGYQVVLAAPDGDAARLKMLNGLDRQGIVPESRMENSRLNFVTGVFDDKKQAEKQGRLLRKQKMSPTVLPVEVNDWSYFVQINGPFDHKMSSKISGIVKKAYPLIKIEKKLCKGVASPQGRH